MKAGVLAQVVEVAVGLGKSSVVFRVDLDGLVQVVEGEVGLTTEGVSTGQPVVDIRIIGFGY